MTAIDRFRAKCRFEPRTGCVLWTGATTAGRGNTTHYGAFWYERRKWYAHRWAAYFIHGFDITDLTVGHCCSGTPDGHPDSLCVEHLRTETIAEGLKEQWSRLGPPHLRSEQTAVERQYWLLVELGYETPEPLHDRSTLGGDIPFHVEPSWLRDDFTPLRLVQVQNS